MRGCPGDSSAAHLRLKPDSQAQIHVLTTHDTTCQGQPVMPDHRCKHRQSWDL